MDFLEKVKGLLIEPSKTFDTLKEEPLEGAVEYYTIIAAVYSALMALMLGFAGSYFGPIMGVENLGMIKGAGMSASIILFVLFMIIVFLSAFIGGAITHIFVYFGGGRKGITQTIKACMFGSTASLLFGWIPIINIIPVIWSIVTQIIGIRQLHGLTTGKVIKAIFVLPIIFGITIFFLIVIAAFMLKM